MFKLFSYPHYRHVLTTGFLLLSFHTIIKCTVPTHSCYFYISNRRLLNTPEDRNKSSIDVSKQREKNVSVSKQSEKNVSVSKQRENVSVNKQRENVSVSKQRENVSISKQRGNVSVGKQREKRVNVSKHKRKSANISSNTTIS